MSEWRITRRRVLRDAGTVAAAAAAWPLVRPGSGDAAPTLRAGVDGPLADPAAFRVPSVAFRPRFRWWWGLPYDEQEFVDEVAAFANAGFSAAEISFTNTIAGQLIAETAGEGAIAGWGTADQRTMLGATLRAAKQHGIHIDQTLGYGWPVRTPSTGFGTPYAQQELMYGRTDLTGPQSFAGQLPFPIGDANNTKLAHLLAVVAAKVVTPGPPVSAAGTPPVKSTILDPASFIDLTDRAVVPPNSAPGPAMISWDVPDGDWVLLGFWQRDSGEDAAYATTANLPGPLYFGTPMDYFNPAAAKAALGDLDADQIGAENVPLLPGTNQFYFEDSLENTWIELPWTGNMFAEFKARRGYDLRKWLPLAFVQGKYHYWVPDATPVADFDLPGGAGARVRHDFDETVTDLYIDYHLLPFQRWAEGHGGRFRSQVAYGLALDVTRSARAITSAGGLAEDETLNAGDDAPLTFKERNWRFAMDHYRSLVSGAHQTGETMVTDELGAVLTGEIKQMFLTYYLDLMDKQWAAGITRPIVHGYSYSPPQAPWPGRDNWAGVVAESWNFRTFPEWHHLPRLADYWARGAMVLEQGQPLTDLAIYRDGFVTTQAGPPPGTAKPFFDGDALAFAGYRYGYLDPQGLLDARAAGAGVLYPRTAAYRALIVDERAIPGAVAESIAAAARGGLAVVFVGAPPAGGTSYAAPAAEDARVARAIAAALRAPRSRVVATQAEVLAALSSLGVLPDAAWSKPVPIFSQHRRAGQADYFYLWNADQARHIFTGSFATAGVPSSMNLWSGTVRPIVAYQASGGRCEVPLDLAPNESLVLAFRRERRAHVIDSQPTLGHEFVQAGRQLAVRSSVRRGTSVRFRLSNGRRGRLELAALPAPVLPTKWALHVDEMGPSGTVGHDVALTALEDWRKVPEIANVSGIGTYKTTVAVPASWLAAGRGVYLGLGVICGSIQVSLNGALIAPDLRFVRPVEVTNWLRPGNNVLQVVLATTLANEIVYQSTHGYPAAAASGGATAQPQTYGLLGPVQLIPFHQATLPASSRATH